jgi:enterochelin esterase-like enzyme
MLMLLPLIRWLLPFAALLLLRVAAAEPVNFALKAPQAREVFLAGEMTEWDAGKRPMARGEDGVWRLTVELAPGQWLYKFVVDGRWVQDPGTDEHDNDGRGGQHSFVFVGEGPWTAPAAGGGQVVTQQVASKELGRSMRVHVYLPAGFRTGQHLPVLWLLHGGGMDADQWFKTGHIERYLDRLLATGRAKPFVVVMPSAGPDPAYDGRSGRFISTELPAWLARQYGLRTSRAQSALAGMSLGGYATVALAARHPAQYGFGYSLGGWFPDTLITELQRGPALKTPLVLRCGTEDALVETNRKLVAALLARGTPIAYRESAGGHSFHYWSTQTEAMLLAVDAFFRAGTGLLR